MKSLPKIILFGKLPPPYIGTTVITQIILNSDLKEHFRIIHLDTSDHRDSNTLAKIDFWNIYHALKQYWMLLYYLIKFNPSLVYITSAQTNIAYVRDIPFILLAKIFRKKVICHLHGGNFKNWYNSTNLVIQWAVRTIQKLVDGQIVLGNNLRELFNWVMPESKIFVVPNGVDFKWPEAPPKDSKIRVLYLANFIKSKGAIDVLEAAKLIQATSTNIEFIFAGTWRDSETKKYFEDFLQNHKDAPVILKGTVTGTDKINLYATADIFVFPTYYPNEGHPLVIVEAMSAGMPIISTHHGAIPESVLDGINGFLVEKRNPAQIAEKLRFLIDNPDVRIRMGKESRRLYLENFTESKMVERLKNTFHDVLKIPNRDET